MADKIVTVSGQGENFKTWNVQAVALFGGKWINVAAEGESIRPACYSYLSNTFSTCYTDLTEWQRQRVVAALKRHPECR